MKSRPLDHKFCSRCGGLMMEQTQLDRSPYGSLIRWWACIYLHKPGNHDAEFLGRSTS